MLEITVNGLAYQFHDEAAVLDYLDATASKVRELHEPSMSPVLPKMESVSGLNRRAAQVTNIPVRDADTVLADILEHIDAQISGQAEELFDLFRQAKDKNSFMNLFQALTGVSFEKFLDDAAAACCETLGE